MVNSLYHDESGVSLVVSNAMNKINEYQEIISQLELLIERINQSDDWKDVDVKTAFISKCNSYINRYNSFVEVLKKYIAGYLSGKSNEIACIERAFS